MSLKLVQNWGWMFGLLLALAGCCHERVYRCDSGSCGMFSGRCGAREGACHICGRPAGCCVGHPFIALKEAIHCKGCGDCYWDEWYSDPPDECDPCDDCGNYIGERCCPPKRFKGVYAHLKGGRHCPPGCTDACCHDASEPLFDETAEDEESGYDSAEIVPATPRQPTRATPAPKKATPKKVAPMPEPMAEASDLPTEDSLPAPRATPSRSRNDILPMEPEADGDSFRPAPATESDEPSTRDLIPREPSALQPEARKPSTKNAKPISHSRVAYFDDFDHDSPPVHTNKFRMGKK